MQLLFTNNDMMLVEKQVEYNIYSKTRYGNKIDMFV